MGSQQLDTAERLSLSMKVNWNHASGSLTEQVPIFRSPQTDYHPPLFPQILDFERLQGGEASEGPGLGTLKPQGRHGLLTPKSRLATLAHTGPHLL